MSNAKHANIRRFVYCALACEAKPLVSHLKLKKNTQIHVFNIYSSETVTLTVTGPGKTAMAAGVAYSQGLFADNQPAVFLNVGIAGHRHEPLGQGFLIDKISDMDSGQCVYPPQVLNLPVRRNSLQTFAKPVGSYPAQALCDMEGSAFYQTAARFASGELVQCLKVVSDNTESPASAIDEALAGRLIQEQLPVIDILLPELAALAEILYEPLAQCYQQLVSRYHFTTSERLQLASRLRNLNTLQAVDRSSLPDFDSAQAALAWLKQMLDEQPFYL